MKFLFDLFPVFLFFGIYKLAEGDPAAALGFVQDYMGWMMADGAVAKDQAPILVATFVAMIASVLQVAYVLIKGKKVDMALWVSIIVIGVFGGATIYLHNDLFIMWKPTILNWVYAVALFVALFVFKKNMIRELMEENVALPDNVWKNLCLAWMAFFFVVGLVNVLVAFVIFKDNTSAWVSFKAFGLVGMTFAFIIGQSVYLSRYIEEDKA
jgi:intracellular septation protein